MTEQDPNEPGEDAPHESDAEGREPHQAEDGPADDAARPDRPGEAPAGASREQGIDDATVVRDEPKRAADHGFEGELFRGHQPLEEDDPVRIGDFWLDSRLAATPAGVAYAAHENGGDAVMLILMNEGAAEDAAARSRFSGEINAMHIDTVVATGGEGQDEGRMAVRFRGEDDDPSLKHLAPLAPWAALAFDGSRAAVDEALRVLNAVDLERTPPLSKPSGPAFSLHWIRNTERGATRVWPLAWPGRRDRAGWISILVSWLIMLLLTALGLLLAILVFQNAPLVEPPPPIPSEGESGSGSPDSASPSTGTDGSPPTESFSPSMDQPSGDESGEGEPSPNRRL